MKHKDLAEILFLSATREDKAVSILAVGDLSAWQFDGNGSSSRNHVAYHDFSDITAELLELLRPPLVVSPLLTRQFDCIVLAEKLASLGYRGTYRAIALTLPVPEIVRREIRQICPGLDFDVVEWPETKGPTVN